MAATRRLARAALPPDARAVVATGSALGIVGEDHDLGRAVCVSMLFLALKISLIWFYQKCRKQRKCRCMIQNIAGSRK